MPRGAGTALLLGASAYLLSCSSGPSFSSSPAVQLRQLRTAQQVAPQISRKYEYNVGGESFFAGRQSGLSDSSFPARGLALSMIALVTMFNFKNAAGKSWPGSRWMRLPKEYKAFMKHGKKSRYRVKSKIERKRESGYPKNCFRGPALLDPFVEKEPHLAKKQYHYYCNKIYKVIRRATPTDEMEVLTTTSTDEFVSPAAWNTPVFRGAAIVGGAAAVGSALPFSALMHLGAFSTWLGTNVWTTFIAGITMFKNLPRKQFGSLQAKLFPKYFQLGAACSTIMVMTASRLALPVGPAVVSLLATLANLLYLEPKATAIMFQRYERENEGIKDKDVDKDLKAKFGKLHGMSSLANLVALVGLVAHGVTLATRVKLV